MAKGKGTVTLKAQPRGADRLARRLLLVSEATLPRKVGSALRDVGKRAEIVYQAHAPVRTGRLVRGISWRFRNAGVVEVVAEARNPATGYDYVGVTRLGHKQARIEPRTDRAPAIVQATGRKRQAGNRAALRFVIGGRVMYRRSVEGYHPATDWAEDALPEIETETRVVMDALGRDLEVALSDA